MIACMYCVPYGSFTANDASFYKNKVGELYDTLQFQLIIYAIIKIIRRGTTIPHYEFDAKHRTNSKQVLRVEVEPISTQQTWSITSCNH